MKHLFERLTKEEPDNYWNIKKASDKCYLKKKHVIVSSIITGFKALVLANQITHLKMAIMPFFHTAWIKCIDPSGFLLRLKIQQKISSSSSSQKAPSLPEPLFSEPSIHRLKVMLPHVRITDDIASVLKRVCHHIALY